MSDEGIRFTKTGREIKVAVGNRIRQLEGRLARRNEALAEFMKDQSLVRSYLIRVAGDRTVFLLHRSRRPANARRSRRMNKLVAKLKPLMRQWTGPLTDDLIQHPGDFGLGKVPARHAKVDKGAEQN